MTPTRTDCRACLAHHLGTEHGDMCRWLAAGKPGSGEPAVWVVLERRDNGTVAPWSVAGAADGERVGCGM